MGKLYKLEHATTELSPARERLKALLEQKTACEKRREALRIAQTRLVDPTAEAEAAATELARFDHENAEALSRWAKNGIKKDERPVVDTDRRQALIIAKQTAAETPKPQDRQAGSSARKSMLRIWRSKACRCQSRRRSPRSSARASIP